MKRKFAERALKRKVRPEYPDGTEGGDGLIRIVYDRERRGAREILMAVFREEDVLKGTMEPEDAQYVVRKMVARGGGKA